jgi:hypothetical protein
LKAIRSVTRAATSVPEDKQGRDEAADDDQMFCGHATEEMEKACRLAYQCARWMLDLAGHAMSFDPYRSRKPLPRLLLWARDTGPA